MFVNTKKLHAEGCLRCTKMQKKVVKEVQKNRIHIDNKQPT